MKNLLESSIKQNNIVLTVPWIAKYLSMLDYVTLRLPYYLSLYKILFHLHKNCDKVLGNRTNVNNYNASLVKFCLGWLFELPQFPESEYFSFCLDVPEGDIFYLKSPKTKCKSVKERKLDDLDIVDQNILYTCCPFLEEIKKLLSSDALNGLVTVKHITPVTAVQSSDEIAKKKLEVSFAIREHTFTIFLTFNLDNINFNNDYLKMFVKILILATIGGSILQRSTTFTKKDNRIRKRTCGFCLRQAHLQRHRSFFQEVRLGKSEGFTRFMDQTSQHEFPHEREIAQGMRRFLVFT